MKRRFPHGILSLRFARGLPLARRLLRILTLTAVISGSLTLLGGIILFALAQTALFNRWLGEILPVLLRDQLNAELRIRSIQVHVFQGIQLDSVFVIADGDTLVRVPRIELRYTPEALIFGTVAITSFRLHEPQLTLVRRRDSTWNIEHLFKPSSRSSEPPSLLLYVRALELRNARIRIHDQLSLQDTTGRFDPLHADFWNVHMRATLTAHLRRQHYALAVDECSWFEQHSQWRLSQMRGTIEADSATLRIPLLTLELPSSSIAVSKGTVRIGDSSLFYRGHLQLAPLAPDDARHLLPADIQLGQALSLDTQLEGTNDTIFIQITALKSRSTHVQGVVRLRHLTGTEPFAWTAVLSRSQLQWDDVRSLLTWLELPTIDALRSCTIEYLSASGNADSLQGQFRVHLPAGTVDAALHLNLHSSLRYRISGQIQNVNLAQLNNGLPQTNLTARFQAQGNGTTPHTMRAALYAQFDSSVVGTVPLAAATIDSRLESGVFILDTLEVVLPAANNGDIPRLSAHGTFELTPPGNLEGILSCQHLPVDRITNTSTLPQLLSAQLRFKSQGHSLDSIRAAVHADIDELVFQDRAIFPFPLDAAFDFDAAGQRVLTVQSPQLEVTMRGNYTLDKLARTLGTHLTLSDTLISRLVAIARGNQVLPLSFPISPTPDTLDATLSLHIRSLAFLSPLFAPLSLETSGTIVGTIATNHTRHQISFDTIALDRLIISSEGGFYLATMPLRGNVSFSYHGRDGRVEVETGQIILAVDSVLRVGNLRVVRPAITWQWDSAQLRIRTDTAWIENILPVFVDATIRSDSANVYQVRIDGLRVGLSDEFSWSNAHPLELLLREGQYTIGAATLRHEQSNATLTLTGSLSATGLDNFRLVLRSFDIADLRAIPSLRDIELIEQLAGYADSIVLAFDGSWDHPRCSLYGSMHAITYNTVLIGDHELTFSYDGTTLWGVATISTVTTEGTRQTILEVGIHTLPLAVSLQPFHFSVRENSPLRISIRASGLPLATVEPFFPAIAQVRGTASAELTIGGILPGNITFGGTARYDECEFLVPATNIRYRSRGVLTLDNNILRLDTIELYNDPADLVGGVAQINGTVEFQGFQPDTLDISIAIPGDRGFLVMSNATAAVNNTMYGRLVISTEEGKNMRRLHLTGTVAQPRLNGFLRIEEADITFPPTTAVTVQTSSFTYYRRGEGYVISDATLLPPSEDTTIGDLPPRSGKTSSPIRWSITPGFAERLITTVDVTIRRQMRIKMDFSSVEQLVAFVEQENRSEYLRFIREGNRRTELRGTLVVDPSSTYKFYSTFAAGGRLRFTTGAIDNPELDLRAVYDGERIIGADNRRERYRVILYITGTKRQPRIRMTYEINGEEAPGMRGDSVRIMTNALLLVLFGRTQEELTGGSSGSVATSALDQSVNAARSAAVSAFLTNALQGGVIKNVNIDFGSSDVTSLSQARIMLTGQLFGANVTVGGSVADLAQNSQITLDLSVGNALGIEWLRNLIAQFQATANPGQSLSRQQKQWEFRLGWRVP